MLETGVQSLGQEDPLEKEMATHSSILAWEIPWTEEPGRLQSMGRKSWTQLSDSTTTTYNSNFMLFTSEHVDLYSLKVKSESEVTQSCPTSSDPIDCSLPGSSVHRIFRARVLEWGAIAFSRKLSGEH